MAHPLHHPTEIVLAERYVSVLDVVSRCAHAVEQGNWHYLWDSLDRLQAGAERLQRALSTDPDPEGLRGYQPPPPGVRPAAVRAAVAEHGRPYRAARLLHPATPDRSGGESS